MKQRSLLFTLLVMCSYHGFAQVAIERVSNFLQCNNEVFNLTTHDPVITENLPVADYTITYFEDPLDASNNEFIPNPEAYIMPNGTIEQYIYAKVLNNANNGYIFVAFRIGYWESTPLFDYAYGCESYVLTPLPDGIQYYTGPGGTGTILSSGDVITDTTTVYPYPTGIDCENSVGITVTVNHVPEIVPDPVIGCGTTGGNGVFNFEPFIADMHTQYPDLYVTLYATQQDAGSEHNAISNIANYYYTMSSMQVIYMRVSMIGADCSSVIEVPLEVTECSEYLSGHVSFDIDGGGCSENDPPVANMHIYYVSENIAHHAYTDAGGNYFFPNVTDGNIVVSIDPPFSNNLIISPDNYSLVFENSMDNVDFCLSIPGSINDVSVALNATTIVQPGFMANYTVKLKNFGNTVANGTVTIEFNDTALDLSSTSIPMVQNGDLLTFNYSNLQPYQQQTVDLSFLAAMPGIVDLGDAIIFSANITYDQGQDNNMANNTYVLTQTVTNSLDPNDINVREGEQITEAQADDHLHYTIRFQNMGDANAHNVKVLTTLDNNLDWDTFEPLIGSHNFQTNRTDNEVEFRFNDIQLPGAEVNGQESHGYVIYRIKPKATVTIGDSMSAEAGIYFDFNPVVNTNSITTTVMDTAGIEGFSNGFMIYPNPATSKVTLQMSDSTANTVGVTVTDVLGKTVAKTTLQGTHCYLDVSSLKSGMYFITLNADGKLATKKLVIK